MITLSGTSPNRRTPRLLDLMFEGDELHMEMHPPGKPGTYRIALKIVDIRLALQAGQLSLEQPDTNRRLNLNFHADDPNDIGPDEVRIQLGTTSGQWWMYASRKDFHDAFEAAGI